eukprot:403336439
MNFSDPIPQSHCAFSNEGTLLAIAKAAELYVNILNFQFNSIQIFEAEKLTMRDKFVFKDVITSIEWSPDDNFIMAILGKQNQIHLRCLNPQVIEGYQEGWTGKIEEGMIGLAGQCWSPDSRQIISFSDLQLRATVWSLVEQKAVAQIRNPKLLPPKGVCFTKNQKFMALAERRETKDWISIYYAGADWKLVNTFEVETFDLVDIMWCKEDTALVVYDTPLEAKVLVYSALTGDILARHQLHSPGLGVKSVSLSPSGIFMAVAYFDVKLRVFNAYSNKEIVILDHVSQINLSAEEHTNVLVYREEQIRDRDSYNKEIYTFSYVNIQGNKENQDQQIIKLPLLPKKEIQAYNASTFEKVGLQGPPTGVSLIQWSFDSKYMATKCDQVPNVVYIWDMQSVELHSVLVHLNPVKNFSFGPLTHQLCIATSQSRFFTWNPFQAAVYELTSDQAGITQQTNILAVNKIKWNPKGNKLILIDKGQAMIAFPGYEFSNFEQIQSQKQQYSNHQSKDRAYNQDYNNLLQSPAIMNSNYKQQQQNSANFNTNFNNGGNLRFSGQNVQNNGSYVTMSSGANNGMAISSSYGFDMDN